MKFKKYFVIALIGILGVSVAAVSTLSAAERPPVSSFSLTSLGGKKIALKDYRDNVVLVNFWASWCPPCVHELPSMQALRKAMEGQPFEILALNMGEHRRQVENFRANFQTKLKFPILLDADRNMTRDWRIRALPTSMLVDKNGRLVQTLLGPRDWNSDELKQLILSLVKE